MVEHSKIEWTDHTFNPWIGCTKVGPGCDNCYAERLMDKRWHRVEWGIDGERKRTTPAYWRQPLRWNERAKRNRKPARVFCASLADVFDVTVDMEWRSDLFALIRETPWLNWLLLTKRIGNVRHLMLPRDWGDDGYQNVWIGATVVTQKEAERDIPKLDALPARVRFLSCEPLLEAVDLQLPKSLIDWVIVGGESGPNARPLELDWCTSIAQQCDDQATSFFMKQGSQANWPDWKDLSAWPESIQRREIPGADECT